MPTTSNGDCCVELMQGTLVRPIARYPSSIAYDDPLKVASNRVRTTLVRNVGTGDTMLTVSDASRIVPQMLFSLDNEIISVSSVDYTANVLTVIRGFDGTHPACHSAGTVLNANIVAWHHNVLAAEITAIETALGPNLSNLTGASGVISSNYIWSQSPGGDLTVGVNVVTLTPVPKGVYGVAKYHYVRISGGTGAAETCLISGGTATPGAASGTITITCANAHSGAWSIGTATSGIQEAIYSLPQKGGVVELPPGNITIYKGFAITPSGGIDGNGVTVRGQGIGATTLDVSSMGSGYVCWIKYGASNWLEDFFIRGHSTSAMTTSDYAVIIEDQNSSGLFRVDIAEVPNGVKVTGTITYRIWLQYMNISYLTVAGAVWISIEGGADHFLSYIAGSDVDTNDLASIRIRSSGGTTLDHCDCLQAGLLIDPDGSLGQGVAWLFVSDTMFDSTKAAAMKIAPVNGGTVFGATFSDSWFSSSTTGNGVTLAAVAPNRIEFISFTGLRLVNNTQHGMQITGSGVQHVTVSSSLIMQNNTANAGFSGIHITDSQEIVINANHIATQSGVSAKHTAGIAFGGGPIDNVIVTDNIIQDFTLAPMAGVESITTTNPVLFFSNNIPTSSLVLSGPSAATVNLGGYPVDTFHITGTIPIATLLPVWIGRKVTLVFDDAAPGGVTTGGNIRKAKTVTQNSMLLLQYEAAGWNVLGP